MALVFLQPDPLDGRVYPRIGRVISINHGLLTLREKDQTIGIPLDGILRIEWEDGEEVQT